VPLDQGDLIVIDEASMVSNPDFADIVGYATKTGAKVAVALDHQQLQAVENGGASLVTRKQGSVQLREPVRFAEQWERSASLGIREGKIAALADYAAHGRIRAGPAEDILEAAVMRTLHTRWKAKTRCSLPVPMNCAARHAGESATTCSISAS
jgi:ATP-dependent exoDNAse (exonuclease V) alpha subunit